MRKLEKPKIRKTIDTKFIEVQKDEEWFQKKFEKDFYPKNTMVSEWNECHFKDISFEHTNLEGISIIDCIFEHCDFSNIDFGNRSFHRVHFRFCKFMGTEFIKAHFYDCLFEECNLNYSNLVDVKMKVCKFIDSTFLESRFHTNQFTKVEFEHCDFSCLEILETSMAEIDVSTCNLQGLRAQPDSLKKMVISKEQSMDIIHLFELIIR